MTYGGRGPDPLDSTQVRRFLGNLFVFCCGRAGVLISGVHDRGASHEYLERIGTYP